MVVFHFKSATNQNQNQSISWWLIHHSAFLQIACLCFSWEHCTLCLIAPHIANAQPLIHNWPNKKCCNSQIIVSVAKQLCIKSNCKTAIVRIGNNTKGFNPIQHCPGFATIIFLEASQWILNQIAEPQKQGHKARQMRVKLDRNCSVCGLSYRQNCRLSICWYFDMYQTGRSDTVRRGACLHHFAICTSLHQHLPCVWVPPSLTISPTNLPVSAVPCSTHFHCSCVFSGIVKFWVDLQV